MFKRNSVEKRRDLGKKMDANNPQLQYVVQKKYTHRNQYDNFSVLQNRIPQRELHAVVIPDYVILNYSFIVWTDFVGHNNKIIEAIKRTLERTPPELAADIVERGIMLAGGGALIKGINDLVTQETGIFTHIAEDPLLCVVNGCGQVLDDFRRLRRCVDTIDLGTNSIRT